jgi:hypothetical protein
MGWNMGFFMGSDGLCVVKFLFIITRCWGWVRFLLCEAAGNVPSRLTVVRWRSGWGSEGDLDVTRGVELEVLCSEGRGVSW